MSIESPARMKGDPELGQHLRALQEPMTTSRLSANADVVSRRIEAGAELVAPTADWLKWVLAGLLALGVGGLWLFGEGASKPETHEAKPAVAVVNEAPAPAAVPALVEAAVPSPPVEPARQDTGARTRQKKPIASSKPAAPHSDLPEQLRLFEEAKKTGASGKYAQALAVLSDLVTRFPGTPLRPDVELAKLEFLMKSEKNGQAIALLIRLSEAPVHRGRHGELLRFLGDLHRKTGDCTAATEAYQRALQSALRKRNAAAVRRGLARCAKK